MAIDAELTGLDPAVIGPRVAKFAAAYLATRWLAPRHHLALGHCSFLLTDPNSDVLDVREIARLSDDLQVKLFGDGQGTEVGLLMYEGTLEAATAFAAMDADTLAEALRAPAGLPEGGRLTRFVSPGAVVRASGPAANDPDGAPTPAQEGLQGIYFTPRELFVGDVVSSTPGSQARHLSLVDGPAHMPQDTQAFDASCVIAAMRFLVEGTNAMLYLPICYSNIIKTSLREDYERMLAVLPLDRRALLAATVYDVPRDPSLGALAAINEILGRHVTNIDLRTFDPGFEIEKLRQKAVTSVTLVVPEGEPQARQATIRRFAGRMELYRRRMIWPGITNIRNRAELDLCTALKVPFVTGAGVCRMQTRPVGGRLQPLFRLPILAA